MKRLSKRNPRKATILNRELVRTHRKIQPKRVHRLSKPLLKTFSQLDPLKLVKGLIHISWNKYDENYEQKINLLLIKNRFLKFRKIKLCKRHYVRLMKKLLRELSLHS